MSEYAGLEAATELVTQLKAITGDKTLLDTTDKSTLVAAINELYNSIFDYAVVTTFDAVAQSTYGTPYKFTNMICLSNGTLIAGGTSASSISGIYRSIDNGATWVASSSSSISGGYFTQFAKLSNDVVLAYGKNHLYKSSDEGVTWTRVNLLTSLSISHITISVLSDDTIIVGTVTSNQADNGVYYSTDSADTWTKSTDSPMYAYCSIVLSDDTVLIGNVNYEAAVTTGDVYISTDKGVTWTASGTNTMALKIVKTTTDKLIAKVQPSIYGAPDVYYSTDKGATWTATNLVGIRDITVTHNNNFIASDATSIYRSTDNGATWSISDNTLTYTSSDDTLFSTNNKVLLTRDLLVYESTDNGVTWLNTLNNKLIGNISIESNVLQLNNGTIIICNRYMNYYKVLNSAVWSTLVDNSVTISYSKVAVTSNGIIYAANDNLLYTINGNQYSIYKVFSDYIANIFITQSNRMFINGRYYSDNGTTWVDIGTDGNNITEGYNNKLFVSRSSGAYCSTDNGVTWGATSITGYTYDVTAYNNNVVACTTAGIYYSTDNGATWSLSNITSTYRKAWVFNNTCLAVTNTDPAGSGNSGIIYSTDNGATWYTSNITTGTAYTITKNETKLIAGTNDGIMCSTDNGATWTTTNLTTVKCITLDTLEDDTLITGTNTGVYYSTDNGATWTLDSNTSTFYAHASAVTSSNSNIITGTGKYYSCTVTTEVDPTSVKPKWETAIEQLASQLNT